jgi:large conductance mechanosensitive channel
MKEILDEFKAFLIKGDLVTIAVGLVMALVFAAVVKALIADLITPIIALLFGEPDFGSLSFTINSSHFLYGDFINNVVTFVTTGFAVFFFVVKPYNLFQKDDPSVRNCPECTTSIPAAAKRCPQCTAVLPAAA